MIAHLLDQSKKGPWTAKTLVSTTALHISAFLLATHNGLKCDVSKSVQPCVIKIADGCDMLHLSD